MPGSSTHLTESPVREERQRKRWNLELIAIGVAACVAVAVGVLMLSSEPERVDQLTVTNPSEYQIRVQLGDSPLIDVEAGASRQYRDVFDQGEQWVFTFSSQSIEAGTFEIDRATLANTNWTVVIPEYIIETLRDAPIEPGSG